MRYLEKIGFTLEVTKSGKFGLWEWGGGFTNTGDATIICNSDGSPKRAVFIKKRGHLACESHALVLVNLNDYIINIFRRRERYTIRIYQITEFKKSEHIVSDGRTLVSWCAVANEVYNYSQGEWYPEKPDFLEQAIEAGKEKSNCYHCREPHYVK